MKKKMGLIFMIIIINLIFLPVQAAYTPTNEAYTLVNYLNEKEGDSFTSNRCQAFVYQSVGNAIGVWSSKACAYEAWQAWGVSSSKDIPLGATVYFSGGNYPCGNHIAGHVGIYVGDGYVVHVAQSKVQKTPLTTIENWKGYSYLGWGWNGGYSLATPSTPEFTVKPSNVVLQLEKNVFSAGEHTTFYCSGENVSKYVVSVYRYGEIYESFAIHSPDYYTTRYYPTGIYTAYVEGSNNLGTIFSNTLTFSVNDIIGDIDACVGGEGTLYIGGWTLNYGNAGQHLDVHIYIGAPAGSEGAEFHRITANAYRPDINNAYGCGEYHGFDYTFTTSKTGEQIVYFYAIDSMSGYNETLGQKTVYISKETVAPVITNVRISDVSENGYTVACDVSDNVAIDRVQFPTWTLWNGQDDLISNWDTNSAVSGTIVGNTVTFRVNVSDHNNEYGLYATHIYAFDKSGNSNCFELLQYVLNQIDGYVDYCVGDEGVIHVKGWASDKEALSQNLEIHVYIGGEKGSENAEKHIIYADKLREDVEAKLNYGKFCGFEEKIALEKVGTNSVYFYAVNPVTQTSVEIGRDTVNIPADTTLPVVSEFKITNITDKSYTITCTVSDNAVVERVQFPTWTLNNDQDDIVWHEGIISENTASCTIFINEHNNEYGTYITDVYAYDKQGNESILSRQSVYITDETLTKTFVQTDENVYTTKTELYNMSTDSEIIVIGYKGGEFVTMTSGTYEDTNGEFSLTGDIDEIKVMAWESWNSMKPLCGAEIIPQSEWITE